MGNIVSSMKTKIATRQQDVREKVSARRHKSRPKTGSDAFETQVTKSGAKAPAPAGKPAIAEPGAKPTPVKEGPIAPPAPPVLDGAGAACTSSSSSSVTSSTRSSSAVGNEPVAVVP